MCGKHVLGSTVMAANKVTFSHIQNMSSKHIFARGIMVVFSIRPQYALRLYPCTVI